ncbi:nucleic acid-binding protein [Clostridium algoriphilum]|uniref:nucleic acid-binding protein n=1 Tax=Clostridium algoriphilum TaxID=198347 RepID=UPI001CF106EC|nr:nucleic acid-binding protein [Clostridium algoriphilum]MCB2296054.1 nucleic acid-binding protein [Clostridium algoriphilum]
MKICNQCQSELNEDFDIKVDAKAYGIKITNKGIWGDKIDKPKVAIFPKCGNVSMYIENVEKRLKNK